MASSNPVFREQKKGYPMAAHRRFMASRVFVVLTGLSLLAGCGDASFTGSTNTKKDTLPSQTQTTPVSADATPVSNAQLEASSSGPAANDADTSQAATTTTTQTATVPQGAVTQGSFTVWADPPNPAPFQDYQIFIRVSLPSNTTQYFLSDISGTLVGTDGYHQPLSESIRTNSYKPGQPSFNFAGQTADISLWVPGTYSKVQDTVQVRSTLLSESQNITIVFQ